MKSIDTVLGRLKRPKDVRTLLKALENDAEATYELLFHAAFASRLLGVLQQAGPDSEGFGRMQQTFGEAVEKVRSALFLAAERGFERAADYTQLTPGAMANLIELMHDLALVKHASNDE